MTGNKTPPAEPKLPQPAYDNNTMSPPVFIFMKALFREKGNWELATRDEVNLFGFLLRENNKQTFVLLTMRRFTVL